MVQNNKYFLISIVICFQLQAGIESEPLLSKEKKRGKRTQNIQVKNLDKKQKEKEDKYRANRLGTIKNKLEHPSRIRRFFIRTKPITDVDAPLSDGLTLLHKASKGDNRPICQELIEECGANPEVQIAGKTPLVMALKYRCRNVEGYLTGEKVNSTLSAGLRAELAKEALQEQDQELLDYLKTEYSFELNKPNRKGITFMHDLCKEGSLQQIELAVENGGTLHAIDELGIKKPAFFALIERKGQYKEIIPALLKNDRALLETQNHKGVTPIMLAAQLGTHKTLVFLIKRGAKINKTDKSGNRALSLAAKKKHSKSFLVLEKAGADINVLTKKQFRWAKKKGLVDEHLYNGPKKKLKRKRKCKKNTINKKKNDDSQEVPGLVYLCTVQ